MSWSRQGYEKASYCISQTGRQPAMQRPTALPRIPASAKGVSTHRSAPNLSRSPAVARKTPPARPTSSPMTITFGSRPSSTWNASLIASTSVSSLTLEHLPQLGELGRERRRRRRVGVLEDEPGVGRRLRLGRRDPRTQGVRCFGARGLRELVVQDAHAAQVRLVASEALALLLLLDPLEVDVGARIVGRRVRGRPVRDRLDERRALTGPGARNSIASDLIDGEHVPAVHPDARNAVTRRLVRKRLGRRLRRQRCRDRPLVVVAEEDERRPH